MAFVFRWLMRLATALVVLGVASFALTYYFASRSLPDYDLQTTARGISAPVEIVRDNANVPHIFGETDSDVYFALGYAHAQDRLWHGHWPSTVSCVGLISMDWRYHPLLPKTMKRQWRWIPMPQA
jgi:hypothetical protein